MYVELVREWSCARQVVDEALGFITENAKVEKVSQQTTDWVAAAAAGL